MTYVIIFLRYDIRHNLSSLWHTSQFIFAPSIVIQHQRFFRYDLMSLRNNARLPGNPLSHTHSLPPQMSLLSVSGALCRCLNGWPWSLPFPRGRTYHLAVKHGKEWSFFIIRWVGMGWRVLWNPGAFRANGRRRRIRRRRLASKECRRRFEVDHQTSDEQNCPKPRDGTTMASFRRVGADLRDINRCLWCGL